MMHAILLLQPVSFVASPAGQRTRQATPRSGLTCQASSVPGSPANLGDYSDYTFAKATGAVVAAGDYGECFVVSDEDAPDSEKSWFYCSDPFGDEGEELEGMSCELVPEWMGTSPSGDHAVWLCSKSKPE